MWIFELILPAARRRKQKKDSDLGVLTKDHFLHIGFAGVFFQEIGQKKCECFCFWCCTQGRWRQHFFIGKVRLNVRGVVIMGGVNGGGGVVEFFVLCFFETGRYAAN